MPTVLKIVLAAVLALPVLGLMACSDGGGAGAVRVRPVARVSVNAEGDEQWSWVAGNGIIG